MVNGTSSNGSVSKQAKKKLTNNKEMRDMFLNKPSKTQQVNMKRKSLLTYFNVFIPLGIDIISVCWLKSGGLISGAHP